jgi:NAD(P)-dependent dehydrogenase (short-subunit alcohol dehydrogenase family)
MQANTSSAQAPTNRGSFNTLYRRRKIAFARFSMNIVITGSSTGIGRALAQRLLAGGHRVWGLARTNQAQLVADSGGLFQASRCDVADWAEVAHAAGEVAAAWPHVDALVTCAGQQGEISPAAVADPVRWSQTVRTNLDGTFFALRAFDSHLARAPRRAKVVCFSGGGSTKSRPHFSAYAVSKTAIVRLVETMAEETKGQRIDINAIAPGAINTRLTDEVLALGPVVVGSHEHEAATKQKASGGSSMVKALDLVEWLLSPPSDGISGRLISAVWDPWPTLQKHAAELANSDVYTLRRILPEDRGLEV